MYKQQRQPGARLLATLAAIIPAECTTGGAQPDTSHSKVGTMSEPTFDVIFRGDIQLGHNLPQVKLRLQQLFNTDSARIDALFSGRPVPLKRQLDATSAERYRAALLKAGALVTLVASEAATKTAVAPPTTPTPATHTAAVAPQPTAAPATWSLAPTGSDLLDAHQRSAVSATNVDTDHLSLRPPSGELLDANERPSRAVASVVVPPLDLAEVGADLLRDDEKYSLPLADITPDDWGLAATGSDLLLPSERQQQTAVAPDVSHLVLSPAGSDLGQIKSQRPPLNPDISKLSLDKLPLEKLP